MDGGLRNIGQLKEIIKGNIRYYFLGFGALFGLLGGVLVYTYGLYLLFAINYECECQRFNIATYLDSYLDQSCRAYAENDYEAWIMPSESNFAAKQKGGAEYDSMEDPQAMLSPSDILKYDSMGDR